jgi:hypothetical protein
MIPSLFNAVQFAYPNVVVMYSEGTVETARALDANGNVVELDKSKVDSALKELQLAELKLQQDKNEAYISAVAKLSKLGLTEEEIKTIMGQA